MSIREDGDAVDEVREAHFEAGYARWPEGLSWIALVKRRVG
jgi:hypothetical protein